MILTTEYNSRIEKALESIRPFLRADGGDVELISVSGEMEVTLKLHGACKECSMSEMTMKAGVEDAIKKAVPEVREVLAIK